MIVIVVIIVAVVITIALGHIEASAHEACIDDVIVQV